MKAAISMAWYENPHHPRIDQISVCNGGSAGYDG
jgi:hypothetical protein